MIRKSLYFNYDHYKALGGHAFKNDGEIFRLHLSKSHLHIHLAKRRTNYHSTLS